MNKNSLPVVFVVVISIGDTSVVSIVIIDSSDAASVIVARGKVLIWSS
jgi:phosphate starvation-inducible membrane PsiE